MARPARVRIRSRNPWVFARRRLFGWKVRLLTVSLHHVSVPRQRRAARPAGSCAVFEHTLVGSAQAAPPGGGTRQETTVRIHPGAGQTRPGPAADDGCTGLAPGPSSSRHAGRRTVESNGGLAQVDLRHAVTHRGNEIRGPLPIVGPAAPLLGCPTERLNRCGPFKTMPSAVRSGWCGRPSTPCGYSCGLLSGLARPVRRRPPGRPGEQAVTGGLDYARE